MRPQWVPIAHKVTKSIEDMNSEGVETMREFNRENVKHLEEAVYTDEELEETLE